MKGRPVTHSADTSVPPDEVQPGTPMSGSAPRLRTDLGNAERLADRAEGRLLWVYGMGWLVWDGRRWTRDESNRVGRLAKATVRAIHREAGFLNEQAAKATDADEREKW